MVCGVSRDGEARGRHAELLEDLPSELWPHPFSNIEHRITTLEAVTPWLGGVVVVNEAAAGTVSAVDQ